MALCGSAVCSPRSSLIFSNVGAKPSDQSQYPNLMPSILGLGASQRETNLSCLPSKSSIFFGAKETSDHAYYFFRSL